MKRSLLTVVALLSLSGAVLAGCGSSTKTSSTPVTSPPRAPASSTPTAPSTSSGGTAVTMKNISFSPASVTVKVGQKITWTNQDSVDHNVTATSGGSFKSKDFGQGATYSFTPTKAGTISYVCTIHPGMDGKIVVTK